MICIFQSSVPYSDVSNKGGGDKMVYKIFGIIIGMKRKKMQK